MTAVAGAFSVEGVRIAIGERGAGEPVALLHGFAGSARDLAPLADRLASRRRGIAIDLIGHGASDAPRELAPYAMERCVARVDGVLAAAGARPAHVFGYSMGGRIALALAAMRPRAVRSLALLGASAGIEDAQARAARRREDDALADRIEAEGVPAFADHWARLPLFATQRERLPAALRQEIHQRRLANRAHGLANALRGMGTGAQPALHARLAGVRVPVWLGYGALDAKFAAIAGDLARRLPDARPCAIPAAGHAAHLENADAVAAELERFLDEVEASEVARHPPRPAESLRAAPGAER